LPLSCGLLRWQDLGLKRMFEKMDAKLGAVRNGERIETVI